MNRESVSLPVFFKKLGDFFLPRLCASCEKGLDPEEEVICGDCFSEIKYPAPSQLRSEFRKDFETEGLISDFASLFLFQKEKPVQSLIHDLKYRGIYKNGIFIGKLMAELLEEQIRSWRPDIVIPVPLHRLKKVERGYNQTHYIAAALCRQTGIELEEKALKRVKYTETQTFLDAAGRRKNLSGAFKAVRPEKIKGKRIILTDDIITTGSTLNECADILKQNGAERVFALSAALAE